MEVLLAAQINLVFQVFILLVILAGWALKKRAKLFLHGVTMLIGVILNTISFILVMGPSLLSLGPTLRDYPLNRLSIVTVGHAALGSTVEILALWTVASWHLQSSIQGCVKKKKIMLLIMILWLTALFLGILLYVLLYTTII